MENFSSFPYPPSELDPTSTLHHELKSTSSYHTASTHPLEAQSSFSSSNVPIQNKPKSRSRKSKSFDSTGDPEGTGDQKRKRKKSISKEPGWSGNGDVASTNGGGGGRRGSFDYSPSLKRPRGRPPLGVNGSPIIGPVNGRKSFSAAAGSNPSGSTTGNQGSSTKGSGNGTATGATEGEPVKIPRPTYKFVVSRVLSKLMVSEPISGSDLTKLLTDCPKDMIHSVLEISQVLGMVIQSKAKEGLRPDYPAGTVVYSFINYVKCPNPVPLDQIEKDITTKIENEKQVSLRMAELYALSERQLSIEDRREALKALIIKFLSNHKDNSVKEIPLYRSLLYSLDPHHPLLAQF